MSFLKSTKAKRILIVGLAIAPICLMAAAGGVDTFGALEDSGSGAKSAVQGAIKSIIWILALLPMGIGFFAAFKMKEYLENKEEQNQHEPKWMKNGKIIAAFGGGILITFILFGVMGKVFLDKSFSETWKTIVMDGFWKDVVL